MNTAMRLPCQERPDDLWFADAPDEVALAQALCRGCPVRRACLEDALDRGERWGVWGGEIIHDGVIVAVKPRVGRPRKDSTAA
ncbi:WhiB family transcriptional regulator [Knoellia subterranea]|uniref:Transcriptional regulator WhiB n=1 Tax=Knoellia subterranea KCTC 19937 TaxID=1385521 RepID=A0A0A0JK70_9MICO|nr:WhiB family transcriptional regulator [Knoellia subterranea]KGN37493.1 WhiB family transcriptional regulator [Knoellia subterranea KCTC 19937]